MDFNFLQVLGIGMTVCILGPLAIAATVNLVFPSCTRCQKRKPVWKLLNFHGVYMCEHCENIASYYWDLP